MTEWDDAVAAVRAGADPAAEAARRSSTAMTDDERHGCLDGDLPFWAGLADLGTGGYHRRPFPAARVAAPRHPRLRVQRRSPRRRRSATPPASR